MATTTVPFPLTRRRSKRSVRRPQPAPARRAGFLEVCFVKRIDNSRLRRQVNPERRRQCFTLLSLGGIVFGAFLMLAWQHFQCVRFGYGIQQLKNQQSSLVELNRELRLEQASLADPQRIDQLARKRLGLATPAPEQIIPLGSPEEPARARDGARQWAAEAPRGQ